MKFPFHKPYCFLLLLLGNQSIAEPQTCTYTTYIWNAIDRKANSYQVVKKPYAELLPIEKDAASGCTVCEEDQRLVHLEGIKPFTVCARLAESFRAGLMQAMQEGQLVRDVVGYRVGKTKGDTDDKGNRTQFSNHSYGIAIDVNTDSNGLYDNCLTFSDGCRLIKGGEWSAETPESIQSGSPIVRIMESYGFKWGGQIEGKQKDFMHFSQTGY